MYAADLVPQAIWVTSAIPPPLSRTWHACGKDVETYFHVSCHDELLGWEAASLLQLVCSLHFKWFPTTFKYLSMQMMNVTIEVIDINWIGSSTPGNQVRISGFENGWLDRPHPHYLQGIVAKAYYSQIAKTRTKLSSPKKDIFFHVNKGWEPLLHVIHSFQVVLRIILRIQNSTCFFFRHSWRGWEWSPGGSPQSCWFRARWCWQLDCCMCTPWCRVYCPKAPCATGCCCSATLCPHLETVTTQSWLDLLA